MKKSSCYAVLGLFWTIVCIAPAAARTGDADPFIDAKAIPVETLLPNPPAADSPKTGEEILFLLNRQATRTPTEIERAKAESKFSPVDFDDVLGSWFTENNLPETTRLLGEVVDETKEVYKTAKERWNRPRPPLQDSRIHPVVDVPKDASYPSGHSTQATVVALVLAELAPDLRDRLIARGNQIGDDRLIAGVHFPSDVEAGRVLGRFLFEQFKKSPAFEEKLAKAKIEFDRTRAKGA